MTPSAWRVPTPNLKLAGRDLLELVMSCLEMKDQDEKDDDEQRDGDRRACEKGSAIS
jgi:hypothetical protein